MPFQSRPHHANPTHRVQLFPIFFVDLMWFFYATQYLFIPRHPIIKRDKMAYCTPPQVRAICDTDITDPEITELVEESDWLIDSRITSGSISAIGYRRMSRLLTAYVCMLKDPNAIGLGEYSHDRATALKLLKEEIDWMWLAASGGAGFTVTIAPIA